MSMKQQFVSNFSHPLERSQLSSGAHILTYAEEGFSPLTFYCGMFKIPKDLELAFQDSVNSSDAVGTMEPYAPISAIPRRLIRENYSAGAVAKSLRDWMRHYGKVGVTGELYLDFQCPSTPHFVTKATEMIVSDARNAGVQRIYIVNYLVSE